MKLQKKSYKNIKNVPDYKNKTTVRNVNKTIFLIFYTTFLITFNEIKGVWCHKLKGGGTSIDGGTGY